MDKKDLLNTHTFNIDITVPSGENFKGSFSVHRPTIGERIRIGVQEGRELQGLINVDMLTSNLAHILSTLEIVVDTFPVWWKPRDLKDMEVLQAVYEKYIDYLLEFQGSPKQEPEKTE
jgi:hypothetical protein